MTFGRKIVFGVQPVKRILAPAGKWRLRLRRDYAARLYIKTADGIQWNHLEDRGDYWFWNPETVMALNKRS